MDLLNKINKLYLNNQSVFGKNEINELISFFYYRLDNNIFKSPEAKEMRGIVFNRKGNVVVRPFPKFFNLNEPLCDVNEYDEGICYEKIDGSMLALSKYNDEYHWTTTKGLKDDTHPLYKDFKNISNNLDELFESYPNKTLIFEIVNPNYSIVIDYPELKYYLLAIRDNKTGVIDYNINDIYSNFLKENNLFSIPSIMYEGKIYKIKNKIKNKTGIEGVCVYTRQSVCKIKTDWYVDMHRKLHNISNKTIINSYLNNEIDDFYPYLNNHNKKIVDKIINEVSEKYDRLYNKLSYYIKIYNYKTPKEIGISKEIPKEYKTLYIRYLKGEDLHDIIKSYLLKIYKVK